MKPAQDEDSLLSGMRWERVHCLTTLRVELWRANGFLEEGAHRHPGCNSDRPAMLLQWRHSQK